MLAHVETILVICAESSKRRALMRDLRRRGHHIAHARGRVDGLRLLFKLRPGLIVYETTPDSANDQETLDSIRLLTDTPIVLLVDTAQAQTRSLNAENTAFVVAPVTAARVWACAKELKPRSLSAGPKAIVERVAAFGRLRPDQLLAIDQALHDIGDSGEVHLVLDDGRLRFIAKICDEAIEPGSAMSTDEGAGPLFGQGPQRMASD